MTNEEFIKSVSLEGEEWKDVPGFEGLYQCSNYGRVVVTKMHVKNARKMMLMKLRICRQGYYYLLFYKNNKRKHMYIHRLVATLFIPNPNNYPQIDHIDCNRLNCYYKNLRWCTPKMNMANPITKRRMSECQTGRQTSKAIPIAQLKDGKLIQIHRCALELDKEQGLCFSCIRSCCRGRLKTYKGFQWMNLSDYESLINKSKNEPNPQEDYQQLQPPQDLQLPQQLELPL